jgi:nickel transport protein
MRFAIPSLSRVCSDRRWFTKIINGALVALFIVFAAISDASAHRVNIIARVDGDTVIAEAYLSGGAKITGARTEVFDSSGKKILEGTTDNKGIYSFKLSEVRSVQGDLRILLHAGMGHEAEYTLPVSELRTIAVPTTAGSPRKEKEIEGSAKPDRIVQTNDLETMKSVVSQAVEEKIEPLMKMVAIQQKMLLEERLKGPTIAEIVGGIGWILGIVGIAAYFMGRNRKE